MRIKQVGDAFHACDSYAYKDELKSAGWRWSPSTKTWTTTDARRVLPFADAFPGGAERLSELVLAVAEATTETVALSRASDAVSPVEPPPGLAFLPFQRAGIAYASSRAGTLVADEPGLGKTVQSISATVAWKSESVLVIVPASLKANWRREWRKWDSLGREAALAEKGKPLPETPVVILNYEQVKAFKSAILSRRWDALICDEAHFLKNPKAARTRAVLGGRNADGDIEAGIPASRRLFLTGTPILNRPIELWSLVRSLDPAGLGRSWEAFVRRYCAGVKGKYGWETTGATNLPELQEKMRGSFMVRRLKVDVLTELPPKTRQIVALEPDAASKRAAKEEKDALKALRKAARASGRSIAAILRDESTPGFEELAAARRDLAVAKAGLVAERVNEMLEETDKIVVFARHKEAVRSIAALLAEAGHVVRTMTGDDDLDKRQAAVDSFQNDPSVRAFVATFGAAGVGHTLTAAGVVVFAELDWTPAVMTQAEDRLHRIGQKNAVLVVHLVVEGSVDSKVAEKLIEKQAVADAALDGGPAATGDPLDEALTDED